ncbi:MAG TPA: hypothetical protein VMD07_10875, partial [Candidatus Acidoferrales bacterium]|nr:hypothetical protein [Candidatus Acidoferrales bacterium]
ADYRDLWDGNPYVSDPFWRKTLLRELERCALRRAATITTISESLAAPLGELHACGVRVIPNAADTGEWSGIEFVRPDVFRIVHCGSLYDGKRSPRRLFAQIAQMRREGNEAARALKIDFYGPEPGNLIEMARDGGLEDAVTYHGVVDRHSAMRAERSAALLLVIQNDDPRTASEYGSKIFEYEAAGKPILALGPQDSVLRAYIRDKGLGWFASGDDEIREAISQAHRVYESGTEMGESTGERRSARSIAADFVGILPV